ncbi:MAG: DNA translocase FtsK 4TM domain-containing protein [Paludibacteraceae bacterium]
MPTRFGVRLGTEDTTPTVKIEKTPWWQQIRTFFLDPRTRVISGVVLLAIALFLFVAYVSFFFTGTADQSLLDMSRADRREHRGEIRNILGLPGAALADFLIDGSFGLVSIVLILLLVVYGLYCLKVRFETPLRAFVCTVFWLLWGAIVLGFLQLMVGTGTFRWGGAFGACFSRWLNSYIQPVGMVIVLLVTLLIFFVLADKQFIYRCRRLLIRLKQLFRRKPKPVVQTEEEAHEESAETTIDIEIPEITDAENTPDDAAAEDIEIVDTPAEDTIDGSITFTIDTPSDELSEVSEASELPEDSDNSDNSDNSKPSDEEMEITDTKPVELAEDNSPEAILAKLGPYDPRKDLEYFNFPALDLLKVYDNETMPVIDQDEQRANGTRIVTTLRNYGIEIESIKATVGPTVTLYEIVPKAGVRIAKIQNLENDIMLSLSATGIRIIAPMPGKGTVGIEVPNEKPQVVSMHSVIASKRFQDEQKMRLPVAIGRTITNEVFMFDLAKTPHLLVAGATGQGKSVAINAILTSLLYKKHPAELKFVLVDPKMVEFTPYKALMRHYLAAMPDVEEKDIIITDCDKVINTLNSLVIEMENRYKLLMDAGVRNLEDYNDKFVKRRLNPEKLVAESLHHQFLPYIVIVIDEYGDFIMQAGKQVETPIARITQKARAVGMHMILATQRPSVNIVTGVIKANIPTRIALRTQSVIDSRTVLDTKGAEQLIGRGDMLYSANGNVTRIQCAFVDTPEVDAVVEHIEKQQRYFEPYQLPEYVPEGAEEALAPGSVDMKRLDPMFADVARYVVSKQEGSTSRLQRAFEIGYNRAGKLSDQLEAAGIVGPNKGPKGRDVLITDLDQLEKLLQDLNA